MRARTCYHAAQPALLPPPPSDPDKKKKTAYFTPPRAVLLDLNPPSSLQGVGLFQLRRLVMQPESVTPLCLANVQPHIQTSTDGHYLSLYLNFPWMSDSSALKSFAACFFTAPSPAKVSLTVARKIIPATMWSEYVQRVSFLAIQCFSNNTHRECETVKACRTSHYSLSFSRACVRACICMSTHTTRAPSPLVPLCLRQR